MTVRSSPLLAPLVVMIASGRPFSGPDDGVPLFARRSAIVLRVHASRSLSVIRPSPDRKPLLVGLVDPNDVSGRVGECEPTPAWVLVQLSLDSAAGSENARQSSVRIVCSDEGKDSAVTACSYRLRLHPAELMSGSRRVLNAGIVGSVVSEGPAERRAVEGFGLL